MKTKFVYLSILLAFSLSGVNAAVPDCQSVVIGSGVAGMKAAMDLKDGGNKVCLIEKMPFPGGATNLERLHTSWRSEQKNRKPQESLSRLMTTLLVKRRCFLMLMSTN